MATRLLYLEGFDITSCEAQVTAVARMEDGRTDIQLDGTCFYPRGGGQDWDEGTITGGNGSTVFAVQEVRLDEHSVVHHLGSYRQGALQAGAPVSCAVDTGRRMINTRLHSAGHVIDMAVDALELDWAATKGQHYPHLSAVEYTGTWQDEQAVALRSAIEQKANELVQAGGENAIRFMPVEEMHTVCRHVPDNIPKNKPGRVVLYGEHFGIPCGGTHVSNLKQIGTISVPKLSQKKGIIRVSYGVSGIN